ncbi:unannotated protein [freshwater metagenome]|uniref:Unannotated protein n=1 Tax=freshwater metagenome TaxID=449393 RepID=A0A6J6MXF9_9ZZZZ
MTPPLSTGCLPGITRELLITWFGVKEMRFSYNELLQAKAVYLSSSIRLLQRVSKIDQKLIPAHEDGSALIEAFETKLLANINP